VSFSMWENDSASRIAVTVPVTAAFSSTTLCLFKFAPGRPVISRCE